MHICGSLPEVVTTEGQHVRFQVRRKTFAWFLDDHHGDGKVAICCKAVPGEREALLTSDSDRYFSPAYLGARGWIAVRLDTPGVDWDDVADLALESYLLTAPKKLTVEFRSATE